MILALIFKILFNLKDIQILINFISKLKKSQILIFQFENIVWNIV